MDDDLCDLYDLPQVQPGLLGQKNKKQHVSSFVKGGTALMLTSVIDMTVAFSTSYWATWTNPDKGEYGGYGLWKIWHCTHKEGSTPMPGVQKVALRDVGMLKNGVLCQEKMADLSFPAWYVTVQAFQAVGLAGLIISLVMLFFYMFMPKCEKNKVVMSTLIAIAYLAGLFNAVALAVFGFKVAEEIEMMNISEWILSWSFSLACTAFVLNQIAASILVTESKRLNSMSGAATSQQQQHRPIYTRTLEAEHMLPR